MDHSTISTLVFLIVWLITAAFYYKEHKARTLVESQLRAIAGQIAKSASESALANADLVAAQVPLVRHHEMLLEYLRNNEGKSVDEAKDAIKVLMDGVAEAKLEVAQFGTMRTVEIQELHERVEPTQLLVPELTQTNEVHDNPVTHHQKVLQHLRENPGSSVDQAKRSIRIKEVLHGR